MSVPFLSAFGIRIANVSVTTIGSDIRIWVNEEFSNPDRAYETYTKICYSCL